MFSKQDFNIEKVFATVEAAARHSAKALRAGVAKARENPALLKKVALGAGAVFVFGSILDCFGLNALFSDSAGLTELTNNGFDAGVNDAWYGGSNSWSHTGVGGHVGGDGETFYFLDGDSSYISGG